MIILYSCPKAHTLELDKTRPPAETVRAVRERLRELEGKGLSLLAETVRVDVGRLGIPVFMSVAGPQARGVLPTRKQMGKGATKDQAEASALMELMERFGFFSSWRKAPAAVCTWSEAEARFGADLLPLEEISRSVHDPLPADKARQALDLLDWEFRLVTNLAAGREVMAPLNWFRKLGEFNGSSAGNTAEESLLQGGCELIERHVCALIDRARPTLPTIDPATLGDPVLVDLVRRFAAQGVFLILKDFSQGMPVPTVGALAYDPATFPDRSEIVFTAGTASSPVKAAIRAVTEVAQLAGDFITGACYEASGLSKFNAIAETVWLMDGPLVPLAGLPSVETPDIRDELTALIAGLKTRGMTLYGVDTTSDVTGVPSHYSFAPGLAFRERDANASIGLFVGRILAEESEDAGKARDGLLLLDSLYGGAHFTPFFLGLLELRQGDAAAARALFAKALPLQPDGDATALCAFYLAYAHTLEESWQEALPHLTQAIELCPDMKEYYNLRGVCRFKQAEYAAAAEDFGAVITRLDKGSVMDLLNLGMCHKLMGNMEKARHYLRAVLELEPGQAAAEKHLADIG